MLGLVAQERDGARAARAVADDLARAAALRCVDTLDVFRTEHERASREMGHFLLRAAIQEARADLLQRLIDADAGVL
jgi:hypothetical protein